MQKLRKWREFSGACNRLFTGLYPDVNVAKRLRPCETSLLRRILVSQGIPYEAKAEVRRFLRSPTLFARSLSFIMRFIPTSAAPAPLRDQRALLRRGALLFGPTN